MLVSWSTIFEAFLETIQMVSISFIFSILIGLPLGILLYVTRPGQILENKVIFPILNTVINIFRSLPFIILLVAIIPVTKFIVGTSIGTEAAIVAMVFFAGPYI